MTRQRRGVELGLGVLIGAVLVLHLCTLLRYPPLFADEPWFAARAWDLIQTGRNFGVLDHGVFEHFDGHWTFFPWLPIALQSVALRIAGAPMLLPMRLTSFFFGVLLLILVYAIGTVLYSRRTALVAVLLVAVSRSFSFSAHGARYDAVTACLGFLAIALYLFNRSRRAWVGLLSGLCVGLAFETHPHAAVYGVGIGALYFSHFGWGTFRSAISGVLLPVPASRWAGTCGSTSRATHKNTWRSTRSRSQ